MISIPTFKKVYLTGIFLSIFLTFISYLLKNNAISTLIWLFGIIHVFWLSFIGFKRIQHPKDKASVGLRVQTAGYLHTLIGFSGALFQLEPENLLDSIVIPLSYALFTSIIGWCLGGELVNEFHEKQGDIITTEAEKLAQGFKKFADDLTVIHTRYAEQVQNASQKFEDCLDRVGAAYERMLSTHEVQLERLKRRQSELLDQLEADQTRFINNQSRCYGEIEKAIGTSIDSSRKLNSSVASLTDALSREELLSITNNFRLLNEQTRLASDNMGGVATTSNSVAQYLRESRILINELEKLLNFISSYRRES